MSGPVTCTKYVPARIKEERMFPSEKPIVVTDPIPKPKIRAEVEPPTSNMTLYGVCKNPTNPPKGWPTSYSPKDWKSVTKGDYPGAINDNFIAKDLQIERANVMRKSAVTIGDPSQKPERVTQMVSYEPYERERYMAKACFPIGGKYNKVKSDVVITGDTVDQRSYEPMTMRQFQPHQPDTDQAKRFAELQLKNKADMMRSHFVVGEEKVDYRTVAKHLLPSAAPLVKNRPPSAVAAEKNPFVAKDAADARPRTMTQQEVSEDKLRSSIPLVANSQAPSLKVTTTGSSMPQFRAKRQGIVTSTNTQLSTLKLGSDPSQYKPATATQFKGIFFKPGDRSHN